MASWREKLALTAQMNRQEIVKANLSRREMMRLGLLTAGGSLIIKQGLSARWAWADDLSLTQVQGIDGPPSPPVTPFIADMPRLLKEQTDLLAGKRYVSEARIIVRRLMRELTCARSRWI